MNCWEINEEGSQENPNNKMIACDEVSEIGDDAKIDIAARIVLERFKTAFEELAKGVGGEREDS